MAPLILIFGTKHFSIKKHILKEGIIEKCFVPKIRIRGAIFGLNN